MELCSGGSLFTMLENPTNAYGFQEEEFKQVVKDVGQYTAKKLHEDFVYIVTVMIIIITIIVVIIVLILLLLHDYYMTNNYYYYMTVFQSVN